jgi:TPP-dependent pyruvate/acetoin dehydrogenase alpha subunit
MRIRKPEPTEIKSLAGYDPELLLEMYRRMFLIRNFEKKVNDLFLRGLMPGTIHLSHGQEAGAVGTCLALRPDDFITLTHRGHGQALAKGMSPRSLLAELFGKEAGCCHGRAGSLHIGDMALGALPAIAIVGASSPIAAGMAFAFKRHETGQVACNFFGESAANKGDWHEAMNLAAIWSLPVIFLCENNLYGVSTHITDMMRVENVSERAAAYGMPGITIYGNDPIGVFETVQSAAARARQGQGPTLIECLTYRFGGHKRDDPATYRPSEELAAWDEQDPVPAFRARLLADGRCDLPAVELLEQRVHAALEDAAEFAMASPEPDAVTALDYVYA